LVFVAMVAKIVVAEARAEVRVGASRMPAAVVVWMAVVRVGLVVEGWELERVGKRVVSAPGERVSRERWIGSIEGVEERNAARMEEPTLPVGPRRA
jgi:hypothetical protein